MSTDGFGKVRQERTHGPRKPYERRKSLLGRVTETVKDLIAPSWFSSLMAKSSGDQAQREPLGELSEEPEEQFMSPPEYLPFRPSVQQNKIPMNNHEKLGPSTALSHFPGPPSTERIPQVHKKRVPRQLYTTSTGLGLSSDTGTTHLGLQTDHDNLSDDSDGSKSTSGWSLFPHIDRQDYQKEILQLNEGGIQKLKDQLLVPGALTASTPLQGISRPVQDTLLQKREDPGVSVITESPGNLSASRRQSTVFQTSKLRVQSATCDSKPSFKFSLFGSPSAGNTSLFGDHFHESTFYPGKVGYGGAAQFRKGKNRSTAPYEIAAPYRTKIKAKPVTKPPSEILTSTHAKRILETLERMSTPLTDAKKIPVDTAFSDSVLSFTPTSYLKRPRLAVNSTNFGRQSLGFPLTGPPLSQLSTPTLASIGKNRQKFSARVDTTENPSTSSQMPTVIDLQEERKKWGVPVVEDEHSSIRRCETVVLSDSARVGGKMKRDKSHHYSTKKLEEDDDVVVIPDLKTDFTLPVTNMPKFNFGGAPATTPTNKPTTHSQTSPTNEENSAQSSLSSSSTTLEFTFSNPIASSKPEVSPGGGTTKLNFQFSSPINVNDKSAPNSKMVTFVNSTDSTPSLKRKDNNSSDFKPSAELKTGSVNDILGGMSRPQNNLTFDKNSAGFKFGSGFAASNPKPKEGLTNSYISPGGGFKASSELKQGSVMDILGGKNSPEASGGLKPAGNLKQGSVMDILGGKSLPRTDEVRLVKPVGSLKEGSVMDVLGKDLSDQSKADENWAKLCAPTDQWECDTCMIRNKPDVSKCVACGSAKPGSSATQNVAAKPTGSGGSLWELFKPAEGSWECPTCMIQNKSRCISCVACATSKPATQGMPASVSLTNTSGFGSKFLPPAGSWECDTCMIQNKAQDSVCVACQCAKPGVNTGGSSEVKASGPWVCDTCMISNTEKSVKCIACETPQPGAKSTAATRTGGPVFAPTALNSGQSGFKFDTTTTIKDSKPAGGFKFGNLDSSTGGESKGGFAFGSTTLSATTTTTDSSKSSGFVFGNQNSKPAGTGTGFLFGSTSTSTDKASPSGGFSIGKESQNPGFVFGKVTEKSEEKTNTGTGFAFGASTTDSTVTTSNSTGFTFGSTSSKPIGKVSHSQLHISTCPSRKAKEKAYGTTSGVNSNFVFGQSSTEETTTKTLNNNTEVKPYQPENKPVPGGFNFPAQPVQNTQDVKPAFGTLAFKKVDGTGSQANGSSGLTKDATKDQGSSTLKRSSDDVNTQPSAKKAFSFSATPSTTSGASSGFNITAGLKATNNGPTSGDLFKFGQQPNTSTTPSTAPLGTGGLNSITSTGTYSVFEKSSCPTDSVFEKSSCLSDSVFEKSSCLTDSVFEKSSCLTDSVVKSSCLTEKSSCLTEKSSCLTDSVFEKSSCLTDSVFEKSSSLTDSVFEKSSTSAFGSAPIPAFGQTTGSFGTASAFGTSSTGSAAFGVGRSQTPSAAATPSLFGAKANTFGGTNTPAIFGSANSFGSNTTSTASTFGGFNSTPAFGGSSAGSVFGNSTTATTSSTGPTSTGFNFSSSANFNFGSTSSSGSNVFQFGAKADTGPSAATAPQPPQSQTPAFGTPQPAQPFNFSATPNTSFASSTPFTFNAAPANDKNPFSIQGTIGTRRIKKAIRKNRK